MYIITSCVGICNTKEVLKVSDTIKRYSKSKGFESLPREMLQSKTLSLEAIGLLCNLASYPDTWIIYKTELFTRFPKNKRTAIDRIWSELVENRYIVQFRKRIGKKYSYRYFYNTSQFTVEELDDLLFSNFEDGYELYHKDMPSDTSRVDLNKYLFLPDNLGCRFWDVENQQSNKCDNTNDSWDVDFEQSKLNSPKRASNKLTKQEINYKKDDDLFNARKAEMVCDLLLIDDKLNGMAKYLYGSGLDWGTVQDLVIAMEGRDDLLIPELIVQQYEWCVIKQKTVGIGDYVKYFVGGLERRVQNCKGEIKTDVTREYMGYSDVVIPIVEFGGK